MTEHLDFNVTAKIVAQSASRALGLIIAKCKLAGGVPYDVFTHLYDTIVWPTISYGAAVWGHRSYSCIGAVHNRAMRFFLGVGKYTPTAALNGDMAWIAPDIRQWKSICLYWSRLSLIPESRINKRIALWAQSLQSRACRNWFYIVSNMLKSCDIEQYSSITDVIPKYDLLNKVEDRLKSKHKADWFQSINAVIGPSGHGNNKLRTYCLYKKDYVTEKYCKLIMPHRHRSAFCKFRCGVAPLRIETGRFEGLALENRVCPFCGIVEDERHVIFTCNMYTDLRDHLFQRAGILNTHFMELSNDEKLVFLFTNPDLIRMTAKTCFEILQRRNFFLHKN